MGMCAGQTRLLVEKKIIAQNASRKTEDILEEKSKGSTKIENNLNIKDLLDEQVLADTKTKDILNTQEINNSNI